MSTTVAHINERPTIFPAPAPLKVVGGRIEVCYVLRDDVAHQELSQVVEKALGGAKIKTVVQLGNGERHEFALPMPAWNADGKLGG